MQGEEGRKEGRGREGGKGDGRERDLDLQG